MIGVYVAHIFIMRNLNTYITNMRIKRNGNKKIKKGRKLSEVLFVGVYVLCSGRGVFVFALNKM
jgi:hypothetical protein